MTTIERSPPSLRTGFRVSPAAKKRWPHLRRSAFPARRSSPCTRPWPTRICANGAPWPRRRPGDRRIRHPGLAAKFSRWPAAAALTADRLGEHNEDVLRNVLGLSETEIEELYRDKTIVRDPVLDGERSQTPTAASALRERFDRPVRAVCLNRFRPASKRLSFGSEED